MEEISVEIQFKRLKTNEMNKKDSQLREAAINAAKRAYSPYSQFNVGAAVLLEGGTIVEGNNQENIAYPSGMCAERIALFAAGSCFPENPVDSIAIIALKNGEVQHSIAPCGGCRQVMLETERRNGHPFRILLCGRDETIIVFSAKDLLPFSFSEF